jgi:hypothetical protein
MELTVLGCAYWDHARAVILTGLVTFSYDQPLAESGSVDCSQNEILLYQPGWIGFEVHCI